MKKLAGLAIIMLFAVVTVNSQNAQKGAEISAEETVHDFGTATEGEVLVHEFTVKNTGTAPLKLTKVKPSCGCTVAEYTKQPIMPGKTGTVKATYNTKRRVGPFNKSINVTSNGGTLVLRIKGSVKAAE